MTVTRRTFLALTAATLADVVADRTVSSRVRPSQALPGPGPYGELRPPDANGLALPAGFSSRIVATAGAPVPGPSGYVWHRAPDGGAVFALPDGGWVYVSNEEQNAGGVGALRFAADGALVDGYRILDGTRRNCAGGPTPWGTWLSCEETSGGLVYECGVAAPGQGVVRPALGAFFHEAVAVDPANRLLILTEDQPNGRLYRFRPTRWRDDGAGVLDDGVLEAAQVADLGGSGPSSVRWVPVAADGPARGGDTTSFNGGEGAWHADGHVFFTTKGDGRVWDLDTGTDTLELLYDDDLARAAAGRAPLTGVDNVTVSPGGEVFVAEDGGNMELVVIGARDGQLEVASFLRIEGHSQSEVTGPAFHPAGDRLYVSSQRGPDGGPTGMTFEITGPFTGAGDSPAATATTTTTTTTTTPSTTTTEAATTSTSAAPAVPETSDSLVAPPTPPVATATDDDWVAPATVAGAAIAATAAGTVALRRRRLAAGATGRTPDRDGDDAP